MKPTAILLAGFLLATAAGIAIHWPDRAQAITAAETRP